MKKILFLFLLFSGLTISFSPAFASDCETQYSGTCKQDSAGSCSGNTHAMLGSSLCASGEICCVPNSTAPASSKGIVPCGGPTDPCTICHLIIGIHNLIDWGKNILVTITIVGIFISGIIYIVSTGNEQMITKAKAFLSACLIGFAITLSAWLIVNVTLFWIANANPDLGIGATNWYTFTCDTTSSATTGGGTPSPTTPTTTTPTTGNLTDAEARAKLSAAGIPIKSTGNCSDPNNKTCTSLEGIPAKAIDDVIAIKNNCGGNVTINGGTETGHQSHGSGLATLDLDWNQSLAQCINNNYGSFNISAIGASGGDLQYFNKIGNKFIDTGTGEHIHVAFS